MIRVSQPTFLGNEVEYVRETLDSGQLSMGKYVSKFEALVAQFSGAQQAVAVSSGTAGLHLALLALGVGPGDKVVVPACSYIATANAVRYCGAEPVFADVRPDTWTIDPGWAELMVANYNARGVITVHLYGQPAELPRILGGWVLEDACEAHGVPLMGDAAVLSFYGNKILACGEGGAVVTSEASLADHVRVLRGQGTTGAKRYIHEELGFNYRMTELQAAVGCGQAEVIASHLRKRYKLRKLYDELLPRQLMRQSRFSGAVDWVVPVLVANRDTVAEKLLACGVETRPVFPALHTQPQYKTDQFLPISEKLAREGLLLPLHLGMTDGDVALVCSVLSDVIA